MTDFGYLDGSFKAGKTPDLGMLASFLIPPFNDLRALKRGSKVIQANEKGGRGGA